MKRFFALSLAIILVAALLPIASLADYSSMTDDELMTELNHIRVELTKRAESKEGKQVLADADGMTVTYKGSPKLEKTFRGVSLIIPVTITNSGNALMNIRLDDAYINGWKVDYSFLGELEPGMKTKSEITLVNVDEDAELDSLDALEDVKLVFLTYDKSFRTKTNNIQASISF